MMTMLKMVPNWMTILRIMVAPVIAVLIWLDDVKTGYMPALTLFVLASISDFIDGWMARRLGVVSKLGAMLDPIADKVLIGTCLVSLAHVTEDGWWFILPAIIIVTREFLISGLREFMAGRSVNMPVSVLAKWKTTLQLVAIGFLVGAPVFPSLAMASPIGLALLWAAAFVTAQTGFAYYRGVLEHVDKPSQ
mgnify:FL=1